MNPVVLAAFALAISASAGPPAFPGVPGPEPGTKYPRLAAVKPTYDRAGLFVVHHGGGSKAWSADGLTRVTARLEPRR